VVAEAAEPRAPAPEAILPGIVLARCPLPPPWRMDVAVVLARGDRLAVIDSGAAEFMPGAIVPALAALGAGLRDVALVVNTHAHWDHVGGNLAIRAASGAQVCIPAAEAPELPGGADRLLQDGEAIDLGAGLVFTVVATPGHSPGMACLWEPARHLLIVSDAVQGYGPGPAGLPLYFHSGRGYRAGLERLLALDAAVLVLGDSCRWDGPARFVHRGAAVRRFLLASQEAARTVEAAVGAALHAFPSGDLAALGPAVVRHLRASPGFRLPPGSSLRPLDAGPVRSELRDRGIVPPE